MAEKPLVRKRSGDFRWQDVDILEYKQEGAAPFKDVTRQVLFDSDDPPGSPRQPVLRLDRGSQQAVGAMLQREGGATLAEIMQQMGWQKHTVRGFMAGAMKKAGYLVESFKPEGGERTERINQ